MKSSTAALSLLGLAMASEARSLVAKVKVRNLFYEPIANVTVWHQHGFDKPIENFTWPRIGPGEETEISMPVHFRTAPLLVPDLERDKWRVRFEDEHGLMACDYAPDSRDLWKSLNLEDEDADVGPIINLTKDNNHVYFHLDASSDMMAHRVNVMPCRWLKGPKMGQDLNRLEENYLHQGLAWDAADYKPSHRASIAIQNRLPHDVHDVLVSHQYGGRVREVLHWDHIKADSISTDLQTVEFETMSFWNRDAWSVSWRSISETGTLMQCLSVLSERVASVWTIHDLTKDNIDGLMTFVIGPQAVTAEASRPDHPEPPRRISGNWTRAPERLRDHHAHTHQRRHGGGGGGKDGYQREIGCFDIVPNEKIETSKPALQPEPAKEDEPSPEDTASEFGLFR